MIKIFIKKGAYFDSVKLMLVTQKIKSMPGIIEAGVVMGTDLNKDILARVNLLSEEARECSAADLIIGINAQTDQAIDSVMTQIDSILNSNAGSGTATQYKPKSLEGAILAHPESNLAIISIPGHFAHIEARKALNKGLHVLLFSDNISVEDEKSLKEYAQANDLLLMGPDCGTSIINGTPLGFANKVRKGTIGIVGASGTGIQEVSTLIHKQGGGISHAIGTGGRDLSLAVGGITMMQGIKALNEDPCTQIIVLISKPPAKEITEQILSYIEKEVKKPVVINFLGSKAGQSQPNRIEYAVNLEEAAIKAIRLSTQKHVPELMSEQEIEEIVSHEAKKIGTSKQFIRGLYSGGTLNYEAILILEDLVGNIHSNTPVKKELKLKDAYKLEGNASIDLGDDEFTVGRAHPMIDPTLRYQMLEEQINNPQASIILIDIVLGYGAHEDPAAGIADILKRNQDKLAQKTILASICGTDEDPQNYAQTKATLEKNGVIVTPSNRCAAMIAGKILSK